MTNANAARDSGQSEVSMLGIYLNDHLAGATAGTELAHRTARSHRDGKNGATLRRLAAEIAQDRAALLDIMIALGVKVRRYKVGAAWVGRGGRRSSTAVSSPGHPSATSKNWKCCGSAWKERPRAGVPCGPWRTRTRASTPRAWTSSSPGPGQQADLLEDLRVTAASQVVRACPSQPRYPQQ